MTILEDFKKYEDKHGLIQPTIGDGSYNGLTYTSIAAIILRSHGELKASYEYQVRMRKCMVPGQLGLFNRTPEGVGGQEGPDDYIGLSASAEPLWVHTGREIFQYGRNNRWVYNSMSPGKFSWRSWFGRQPQLLAHMSYGAQKRPGCLLRIWWALSIAASALAKPTNQDAQMLSWLLIKCFEANGSPSLVGRMAVAWWDRQLLKKFGSEGLRNLAYLENNKEHPITKWWRR